MKTFNKYFAIFLIAYKNHTAYIYDILGANGIYVVRITVILFLYKLIYATKVTGNIGYSIDEVSWALIFVQALVMAKPAITQEVDDEIKTGKISTYLLTPVSYIWFKFFENFSKFFYKLIIALVLGLVVGFLFLGTIKTSFFGVCAGLILLIGSMFIMFFGYMMVGLSAFFTEDSEGFRYIYTKIDMLLGGNILPIPFLPVILQAVAFLSPFAYSGYTVGLMFVKFDLNLFIRFFCLQLFWIIFFITICNYIYNIGRKRITINGG